ncbi:MAG: pectate lyase [Paludibacteraceae bacterium]|nr:pectate lyase [Paludibacteraceae bacterium]
MNIKWLVYCLLLTCGLLSCEDNTPQVSETAALAFSEAQGGGKYATGGRGGVVLHVTSLSDDPQDPGSLRHAINVGGARTIVFDVAGTIQLSSTLNISNGSLTIAGQSAPGDGICIAGYPVVVKASNVIIRFMRFRMGDEHNVEGDALTIVGRKNIMIDHCSFSWSTDECVSCYGNTDFTLQYCFITESLRNSVHGKGRHGYGGIWGGTNATFHHNLLAHHDSRNPRFDHYYVNQTCFGPIDYVNNVVYNWGGNSTYGGEGVKQARQINMVNNYYKPGPATSKKERLLDPTVSCSNCSPYGAVVPAKFYLQGNYMYGSAQVTADNWQGSTVQTEAVKASTRWTEGLTMLTAEESAEQAFETVMAKAGCSFHRDTIDVRIAEEVRNGSATCKGSNGSTGGLIDTQVDAGGWPMLRTEEPQKDTDRDGIPDAWEEAHGLNPKSNADGKIETLVSGYSNLEVYLNDIVKHLY